jgi:hypothetical protein
LKYAKYVHESRTTKPVEFVPRRKGGGGEMIEEMDLIEVHCIKIMVR